MIDKDSSELPTFDKPPVVEVALGIEFAEISDFSTLHFGMFWERVKKEFPRFQINPASGIQPEVSYELFEFPARYWFLDETDSRLIQLQKNRFIFNWRKYSSTAIDYPHYKNIKPVFEKYWNIFVDFLQGNGFPEPNILSCDVTYVNHIERGESWNSLSDLPSIFEFIEQANVESSDALSLRLVRSLRNSAHKLIIGLEQATRDSDRQELIVFSLTSRAFSSDIEVINIGEIFSEGQFNVVEQFDALTSDKMHNVWGKRSR